MIFSKRTFEGYLCIDHRESPGFGEADAPRRSVAPFTGAGKLFETATNTCSHCGKVVIRNPNRVRPRAHCRGCERFICDDPCAALYHLTGECRCWSKRVDAYLKGLNQNGP